MTSSTLKSFDQFLTPLDGLMVIQRNAIEDQRGFLSRLYCVEDFSLIGITKPIAQINQTLTKKRGAVRGLHYQHPPHAEIKLISCLKGEIWDIAVDLRIGSPTFLKWHAEILSEKNRKSLLIPEGYAHGFQTLTENCELLYLHTASYHPENEGALNITDPKLHITWPLKVHDLSERDSKTPFIKDDFEGIIT